MANLTFNGETHVVDHAAKGTDYIHGYDANGQMIVCFEGITDFSAFTYDGTYMAPTSCATEACNEAIYIDGVLKTKGGTNVIVGYPVLQGSADPTTSTVGAIGQAYYNTTSQTVFICVAHITSSSATQYTWAKTGGGKGAEFGTRGPIVFRASGTFNAAEYGLGVGDYVNVVVIGGGASGYNGNGAGKAGKSGRAAHEDCSAPGGGGGGGIGAGGGGSAAYGYIGDNSPNYHGNGGGGSGYLNHGTVKLNALSIAVTVGAGGGAGGAGSASSFGSLMTAAGGSVGRYGTGYYDTNNGMGGAGGHSGGRGARGQGYYQDMPGGGGGGGWVVNSVSSHSGTAGGDGSGAGTTGVGGTGGTNGGASGLDGAGNGNGAVYIWY